MGSVLRLVDSNHDGQADEYTVFATMDSPRGAVFDGETLYVIASAVPDRVSRHGRRRHRRRIADARPRAGLRPRLPRRRSHDQRHRDGHRRLALHRGRRLRRSSRRSAPTARKSRCAAAATCASVPTARELEIYARGTRNDYDLAIDPYMNLFARGNTNDGGGWDIRLNHFVAGAPVRLSRRCSATSATRSWRRWPTTAAARAPACCTSRIRVCRRRSATRSIPSTGARTSSIAIRCSRGRDVHRRPGSVPRSAAADRFGDRRRRRGCTWRAGRAGSIDTAASRSATSRA